MRELIIDNFAGGGGASEGYEQAFGRPVDIAINHDPDAIAMHRANHPNTKHYCESVWDIDPLEATKGQPVALAHFSPDCKHFSKAKGGKPVEKSIRGLAWIVLKWAGKVRPRVIILENVEEFQTWGPVRKGQPVKSKSGQTFLKWKSQLESLGYKVEHRELRACDYGAPTIRKRFFLIARCDGRPIVWPEPTHGNPEQLEVRCGLLKPWRTAAECIDWSIPCPSIFERPRPLAENTLRRIARGIQKFVVDNPDPFIIKFQQNSVGQDLDRPLDTVMAGATRFGLVTPSVIKFRTGSTGHELNEPLHTVTSGEGSKRPAGAAHAMGLIAPMLIQYHNETSKNETRGQSIEDPLMTLDTSPRYGLVTSHLCILRNNEYGQDHREPLRTVCTSPGHFAEVRAFLIKYYG